MAAPITYGEEKESIYNLKKAGDFVKCYYKAETGKIGEFSFLHDYTNTAELPKYPILNQADWQTADPMNFSSPDGFFYLVCIGFDYERGIMKACPDRPLQAGITWTQAKEAGFMDGTFRTGFGKARIASRAQLRAISGMSDIAADLRNALGFPQSSVGWCGGLYNNTAYYYNTWDGYSYLSSWTLLELTCDETDASYYQAIFDWYGEASQSALLYNYEHGIYSQISINQSKTAAYSSVGTDNGNTMYSYMTLRPIMEIPIVYALYQKDSAVYGMQDDGTRFALLSDQWDKLNENEKIEKFLSTQYYTASVEQLSELNTFKILFYSEHRIEPSVDIFAVSKDQLILPRGFISLDSFKKIGQTDLNCETSEKATCRLIVTTDLKAYQTYEFDTNSWKPIDHENLAEVNISGIPATKIKDIDSSAWDALLKGKSGVGFAYLLSAENTSDICSVDRLDLKVEMKGEFLNR